MKKKKTIFKNRLFQIEGRERETPNDFTRLSEAIDKFKIEFIKAIRIPQIVEWISKQLK
jgi:hypothetical protein